MSRKKFRQVLLQLPLFCGCLIVWVPVWIIVFGSLMSQGELVDYLGTIYTNGEGYAMWPILPQYPTLRAYVEVLLDTPEFFVMFWNSFRLVFPTFLGNCLISIPAAWGLSRYRFKGRKILFFLYIVLMLMPFQVTMVSSYLALDNINLMDTIWAVALPAAFSTFPVFIMVKFFAGIPKALIEAASLDGANEVQIFLMIGLPMGFPGIISALVLSFIENWNAIEQPLTFIKTKSLWPLSLYLPDLTIGQIGLAFVSSILIMLPAVFVFAIGKRYLEEGISMSGIKG